LQSSSFLGELVDLLPELERHLVALFRDYFTVKLKEFTFESQFEFVPELNLMSALRIVTSNLQDEFDSIFIELVGILGEKAQLYGSDCPASAENIDCALENLFELCFYIFEW
jgi:hypothetical protein